MSQKQTDNHKKPRLIVVENFDQVEEKHIVNKGTGAGGANTNKNGLPYEEMTDLEDRYTTLENLSKNVKKVKFTGIDKEYVVTKKRGFINYLKNHNKYNLDVKPLHGAKEPDEAFVDEKNQIIYIIEKKFQQTSGSKCECLQTYTSKIRNYRRRIPEYRIVYIYCLSEWFEKNCQAEIDDLIEDKIPYFWGNSETYKEDIINFIANYK